MTPKLSNLIERIEHGTEDQRFTLWFQIYQWQKTDPNEHPFEEIIQSGSLLIKSLLCRFLSTVEEELSIRLLILLIEDEDEKTAKIAIKNFEKSHFQRKADFLIPLLNSQRPFILYFAIEQLTSNLVSDATDDLIRVLKQKGEDDEALLHYILSGFRFLVDRRLLPVIAPYLSDKRESIRYYALLAIGALYEENHNEPEKYIIKALNDESPRIRQSALWVLRRRPKKKHTKHFIKIINQDSNPLVRQEALLGLALFPSKKNVIQVIQTTSKETNRLIKLKGEAVVLSLKAKQIILALKNLILSSDQQVRTHSILLYAYFEKGSKPFIKFLTKELKNSKDPRYIVILIQALGSTGFKGAIPILEKLLGTSSLIAYTAMGSLLKLWGNDPQFPIERYLTDDRLSNSIRQIVIKHYVTISEAHWYTPSKMALFTALMKHPNINVRYLSAQALVKSDSVKMLRPFFVGSVSEDDPTSYKLLRSNIIRLLHIHPHYFMILFEEFKNEDIYTVHLFSLLREIQLPKKDQLTLFQELLEAKLEKTQNTRINSIIDVLITKLKREDINLSEILTQLSTTEFKKLFLKNLSPKLDRYPDFTSFLPTKDLKELFDLSDPEDVKLYLKILSHGKEESSLKSILHFASRYDGNQYHKEISEAFALRLRRAS